MEGAVHAQTRTSNTWEDRAHALGWHGGGGETTLVHINEGGRRPQWVHIFWILLTPLLSQRSLKTAWPLRGTFGVRNPNLCALDCPGCHNQSLTTSLPRSQGPLRECCSILPGAFGLPYQYIQLVCVSDALGGLAVWRYNNNHKTKHENNINCRSAFEPKTQNKN